MVKRKEKKVKSKSQKQSQKKGSQKQSQSVSVNVNLGKRGGRSKTMPTPKIQPPFPFNFPPFFNPYNQNPNNFLNPPPPIPQKQYATFPEGETAAALGILPTVPLSLKFQTTEPEPNLVKVKKTVQPFAPKADEEPVFTSGTVEGEQPPFFNEPPTTTPIGGEGEANIEPLLSPAKEQGITQLTEEYKAVELPITAEAKEEASLPLEVKKKSGGTKAKERERLKKETLTGILTGEAPTLPEKAKKAPAKYKEPEPPKTGFDPTQTALTFELPTTIAKAVEPTAEDYYTITAPLSQQPSAELQPKIPFVGEQPVPEKKVRTIERRRKGEEEITNPLSFVP